MKQQLVCSILVLFANIANVYTQNHPSFCGDSNRSASTQERILSVQVPGYIHEKTLCKWSIISPPGAKINLTITKIKLEKDEHCSFASVVIYDGSYANQKILGEICDLIEPKSITYITEESQMDLYLKLTTAFYGEGFMASYKAIDVKEPDQPKVNVCGNEIIYVAKTNNTWMIPVNSEEAYNTKCRWILIAQSGMNVRVYISNITFSNDDDCNSNKLEIFSGTSENGTLIGKLCKTPKNQAFTSEDNYMFITFEATKPSAGHGFFAAYEQIKPNKARKMVFTGKWITTLLFVLLNINY